MRARKSGVSVQAMSGRWDAAGFGDLISKILDTARLSQSQLASLAGVHSTTIGRWRAGAVRPDADAVAKLMDGLARTHPEVSDLAARLYGVAGYGVSEPEELPGIVRDNWDDETVRAIWAASVPRDVRVGMITMLLEARENPGA